SVNLAFPFHEPVRIRQLGAVDKSEFHARLAHEQGADQVLVSRPESVAGAERGIVHDLLGAGEVLQDEGPCAQRQRLDVSRIPLQRFFERRLRHRFDLRPARYGVESANWLPSRSLNTAAVPQSAFCGSRTNSTPRSFSCFAVASTSVAMN